MSALRTCPALDDSDWGEIDSCNLSDELQERIRPEEPELSAEDWSEIRNVVAGKLARLRDGFYGTDRVAKDWREHMADILTKLEAQVQL